MTYTTTALLHDHDSKMAGICARVLAHVLDYAQQHSDDTAVADAKRAHDAGGLYPKLTIVAPHGGGAVRVELGLFDPATDELVVSMYQLEAAANDPAPNWQH